MKNLNLTSWIVLITILLTSCVSSKSNKVLESEAESLLLMYENELEFKIVGVEKSNKSEVPSCETWLQDKNKFVEVIQEYKSKNEIVRRKSKKYSNAFIISGSTIGLGGGIYGLFSNSEPKGAAITSMVTGALTALVGTLNIDKNIERSNTCSDFLNIIMLDFDSYWGIARCPKDNKELAVYLKSQKDIIESLKAMKCFGN